MTAKRDVCPKCEGKMAMIKMTLGIPSYGKTEKWKLGKPDTFMPSEMGSLPVRGYVCENGSCRHVELYSMTRSEKK